MSNNILIYNDTQYDLSMLSSQSAAAQFDVKDIVNERPDENKTLLVVRKDDKYVVISGSLQLNQKTQKPYDLQTVKVVGKQLLKRAKLDIVEHRKAQLEADRVEQERRDKEEREFRAQAPRHQRPQQGHSQNQPQPRPYTGQNHQGGPRNSSFGNGDPNYRRGGY